MTAVNEEVLWKELIAQEPKNSEVMVCITSKSKYLARMAAIEILRRGATKQELCNIINWVPDRAEAAAEELLQRSPTQEELDLIEKKLPRWKTKIASITPARTKVDVLADIYAHFHDKPGTSS